MKNNQVQVIILMGVCGSGKTTVGKALSKRLGWTFFDGDDYHLPSSVEKMASGIPLTDEDRWPWLNALRVMISECLQNQQNAVFACSALKQSYRDLLLKDNPGAVLVYLRGSYELIHERLKNRPDHYMKATLLKSQFDALEEPRDVLSLPAALPMYELVGQISAHFHLSDED
jgi:gluconokinase